LAQVELLRTNWPQNWFNVKTALERMRSNFISYDKYRQVCKQYYITENSAQTTLIGFLHDLGVSLHFDELMLQDTKVLKSTWVTQAIYQIINSPQLAQGRGVLRLADLPAILTPVRQYPAAKHAYLVELMKKFELCYALRAEAVLVPDLLEIQEPTFDFAYATALTFRLEYDFLPRSIMPRFIVRLHRDIQNELRWRTSVALADSDLQATAVVKADDEAKTITIWVQGDHRREYFAVLRKALREIHASFEKLTVTELVPLREYPDVTVEYRELLGLESMGESHIVIGKLGRRFKVKDLLNGLVSEQARRQELQELQAEKLHRLQKAHILTTDSAEKFRLEKLIEEEESNIALD
jgi:internalin A